MRKRVVEKMEHTVDTVNVLQENINLETNVERVGANKQDVENASSLDML